MTGLKRAAGSLLMAAAVITGISAVATPAGAITGAATALGWEHITGYPGTPAGLADCRADGKLWGTYQCRYYATGWDGKPKYELWIYT